MKDPIFRKKHNDTIHKCAKQRIFKDIGFKIRVNMSRRILSALKYNKKIDKTMNLVGCSIKDLKNYLQQTAILNGYKDFNINNYNSQDYHIDHIIPCSSFDLSKEEQQRKCFNYTNLQILTAKENLAKSDNRGGGFGSTGTK